MQMPKERRYYPLTSLPKCFSPSRFGSLSAEGWRTGQCSGMTGRRECGPQASLGDGRTPVLQVFWRVGEDVHFRRLRGQIIKRNIKRKLGKCSY